MTPLLFLTVVAAGTVGALLRYGATRVFAGSTTAVLLVNVVGSALGGAIVALAAAGGVSEDLRLIILTGLCGGLTTFSTFSVDTVELLQHARWRAAALNAALNLMLGVGAAALAYAIVLGFAG